MDENEKEMVHSLYKRRQSVSQAGSSHPVRTRPLSAQHRRHTPTKRNEQQGRDMMTLRKQRKSVSRCHRAIQFSVVDLQKELSLSFLLMQII